MSKETTATTPSTSMTSSPADEMADRTLAASLDKVVDALPEAVDQAVRKTPPGTTPEQAAQIATHMVARLTGTACPVYEDCTEAGPGHYDHFNHCLRVVGEDGETILDAGMVHLSGEGAPMVYLRNEEFTDAASAHAKTAEVRRLLDQVDAIADRVLGVDADTLTSIDQQITVDTTRLIAMIAARRRTAIKLNPGRTPFAEPETEQVSAAAFQLATEALKVSVEKTQDRPGTLRAMRAYVDLAAEQATRVEGQVDRILAALAESEPEA